MGMWYVVFGAATPGRSGRLNYREVREHFARPL